MNLLVDEKPFHVSIQQSKGSSPLSSCCGVILLNVLIQMVKFWHSHANLTG